MFAFARAGAHHGEAHARHDRLHVREVEVDQTRHQDQIRDPLDRLAQYVVGRRERVNEGGVAVDDRQQPFVGDRDDGVHALAQRLEAGVALHLTLPPLELEGFRDHGDRQGAELARETGDDRRRAGARTSAESGRDEDHVGAAEGRDQLIGVLERRLTADVRIRSSPEPFGELAADLQLHRRGIRVERLQVGVGDDEFDTVEARLHHPAHGVAAAAAHSDHLDARARAPLLVQHEPQLLWMVLQDIPEHRNGFV